MVKTLRRVLVGFASAALLLLAASCQKPEDTFDVASVTFSPAGGNISVNEYVTLSCETEGAEIYWSKTQELTSSNFSEGTPGSSVQVTSDDGTAFVLYAIAVYTADSGSTYCSSSSSAAYTVKYLPTVTTDIDEGAVAEGTKVTITANPAYEGDTVILYYTTDGTELTSENYASAGTKVEMAEGATSASAEIEITNQTTIYAVAVDTTQNTVSEVFNKTYSLQLRKVTSLADGDVIIILYTNGTKNYALTTETSTSSSSKLYGKTATVTDDVLEANDSFARLTVRENKAGQFVLVNNGKYLTSGSTGNSLAYSDTYSCYALWEQIIETDTDTDSGLYFMDNANAIYNSNRQRLEYYSGFTTYTQKTTDAYKFTFWKDPNATAETVDMTSANKLETPEFSLEATDSAMLGANVYVTSASLNATVYYSTSEISIDDSFDLTSLTDASAGFTLPSEAAKQVTYYAVAVVSYTEDSATKYLVSDVASVTYTTISVDTNTYLKPITDVSSIEEDSVVAINYTSSDGTTCISLVYSDGTLATEESVCTTSGLVLTDTMAQFTVKKDNGYYVFVNNGNFLTGNADKTLSLSDSYTENAQWEISTIVDTTSATDGKFFLKNVGSEFYIEYYNSITTYSFNTEKAAIYSFGLYKNESATAEIITLPLSSPELSSAAGLIPSGTVVTATTSVTDAKIYYKWIASSSEDSAPTTASEITDELAETGITITEAGTLYVVSKTDTRSSAIVSAVYTVNNGPIDSIEHGGTTFKACNSSGTELSASNTSTTETALATITTDNVTITFSKGDGSSYPRYWTDSFRIYKKNTVTFTPATGKTIKQITFEGTSVGNFTCSDGTFDSSTYTWTPDSTSSAPVFTYSGTEKLTNITIILENTATE